LKEADNGPGTGVGDGIGVEVYPLPEEVRNFSGMIFAFQFTPIMPMPLLPATA